MVSADTLLDYKDWTIPFTVYNNAYYKQLGAIISHNNKQKHLNNIKKATT